MKNKDMILINADTDSISIAYPDGRVISPEEQQSLLDELNSLFPETIKFEHDGYFDSFVVVKAKNYIMRDEKGKMKTKGSAFKDLKKEQILKDMQKEISQSLLDHNVPAVQEIYKKYIKLSQNVTDVLLWSKKATITKAILACRGWTQEQVDSKELRMNEISVWEAVKHTHIQEGDRVQLYPAILKREIIQKPIMRKNRTTGEQEIKGYKDVEQIEYGLKLVSEYNNDVDTEHMLQRVYSTLSIFKTILNMDDYIKYHLKTNRKLLIDLLSET